MKRIFIFVTVLALGLLPLATSAAEFKAGDQFSLRKNDVISGDLYTVGGNVSISGNVEGDLMVAGGNVFISGNVGSDLTIAGGSLNITGNVGDDLRIVGGSVFIDGNIGGDLVVAGGDVRVSSGAVISGGLYVRGGSLTFEGSVNKSVDVGAGMVFFNGLASSDVKIVADKVSLGSEAMINGNLKYVSPKEAIMEPGSTVIGSIDFSSNYKSRNKDMADASFFGYLFGVWALLKVLGMIIWGLIVVYFLKDTTKRIVNRANNSFWKQLLVGFVTLVALPIASILVMFTVMGIPLGIIGFLLFFLWLITSGIFFVTTVGGLVYKYVLRKKEFAIDWKLVLWGVLATVILALIPVVGWLILLLIFISNFGTVVHDCYEVIWHKK